VRGADRMLVPRNFLCACPFSERMEKTPNDACDFRARARSARGAPGVVALGLALLSALALSGLSVVPAVARAKAAPTTVLTPKFTRVGTGQLIGDSRYVVISEVSGDTATGNTVIDTRTGQRTYPFRAGCAPDLVGGTSILFLCDASLDSAYYELYSIPSSRFRPLNVNPLVPTYAVFCYEAEPITCDQPTGIGTRWISFQPMNYHAVQAYIFQNLATGAAERAFPSPSQNVDLDSPALVTQLCTPTTEPPDPDPGQAAPSVAVDGKFVIAAGYSNQYLEHCGTPRHRFLTKNFDFVYPSCWSGACPVPFSSHAVIWQTDPTSSTPRLMQSLSGYFLPSLRRFKLDIPDNVGIPPAGDGTYTLVLTSRRLYVQADGPGSVWSAPIPTTPPSVMARAGLEPARDGL
jgi:hypothetical protein